MKRDDDFSIEDWYLLVFALAPLDASGAELRYMYRLCTGMQYAVCWDTEGDK
jgi:hypothetical protein